MSELEDIKLQALLQSMQLDSPGEKFSARVMNRIFATTTRGLEEVSAAEMALVPGLADWVSARFARRPK